MNIRSIYKLEGVQNKNLALKKEIPSCLLKFYSDPWKGFCEYTNPVFPVVCIPVDSCCVRMQFLQKLVLEMYVRNKLFFVFTFYWNIS